MFQETAKSLPVNDDQILQMPPFESYFFYIGIVLFVEGIEASNSEPSTKELRPTLSFLRVLQKKWEIAGEQNETPNFSSLTERVSVRCIPASCICGYLLSIGLFRKDTPSSNN